MTAPMDLEAMRRLIERRTEKDANGCWLWVGPVTTGGYGRLCWTHLDRKFNRTHRVAYAAFKGDPGGLHVCHTCDVPRCCNPEHLWLGTHADNHRDKVAKGRCGAPRGEAAPQAKLKAAQVLDLVSHVEAGEPQHIAAERFGVTQPTVSYIMRGRTWSHLTGRGQR
jgi:hypothetical protein